MFISCNFTYIIKLNFLISIILVLSVSLSKANVLKENQVQSGVSITEHGTLQLNESKEFVSLTHIIITNDTDNKTVQNPPEGTLNTNELSTDAPTFKNPVKNRRSTCVRKEVDKNVKRRTKPKHELRETLPPTPETNGLGNLNDLIRGVQIFNDPKVSQDINAFKTLLDAFEQMKKSRSQNQEDDRKNSFDDSSVPKETDDDDDQESDDHLMPRNTDKNGNKTSVKVKLIPPSKYSYSGPNMNVSSNKHFNMDYEDYVPPQNGDSNTTNAEEDEADYSAVELSVAAPNKRSLRRLNVRESGPSPPKANTSKNSRTPSKTIVEPHLRTSPETYSKAPAKSPTEASAKAVPPATTRTETSGVMRIVKNITSDHFSSLQDLWKEYQIAIVTVPALFLVLLLIVIIYLIGKTGKGYQSVPSSSYESDTETGTVQPEDAVSKNCPPQKEYLPYMEPPEPKKVGVSDSERIIKTLGGYTLIRTKDSIDHLMNFTSKMPPSGKSVATQAGNSNSPSCQRQDPPFVSQPLITESRVPYSSKDEDDDDDDVVIGKEGSYHQKAQEPKKPTGCSPCCSPKSRTDPVSSESIPLKNNNKKAPKRRRRKPRKSPSYFRGCLSGPTDESADTEDDDSHRLPSNDECIQSVVTQGAILMKTEEPPVRVTRNEMMKEVLKTDVKEIDDMLTDGNWERAYYKKGGNVRFSDGQDSESPGPGGSGGKKCKKGHPSPKIAASEDGVFTMKYYLGSSANLSEKNPVLQRPF